MATMPGLVLSYFIGSLFEHGLFQGIASLSSFSYFVFRITLASLSAYLIGQIADIMVFQRLRRMKQWWPAPTASSILVIYLILTHSLRLLSITPTMHLWLNIGLA